MTKKKPFALRVNIELLKAYEEWANQEFRSVNGQIEYVLTEALKKHRKSKGKDSSL